MEVRFYDQHVERFVQSLEKVTIAKVLRMINLLERFGHELGMPQSKPLRHGLFELRIRGVQEVRLLYTYRHNKAIIVHGFIKKTQKLSASELTRALRKKRILDGS